MKLLASALSALILTVPTLADAAQKGTPLPPPFELARIRGGAVIADPIVNGSRVYLPTGRVIATWSYARLDGPMRVSSSQPAAGAINGLARHGNYLYASWRGYDGSSGVATYSLADPARPRLVSDSDDYVDSDSKFATGLVVANGHLYLFDNNNGVFASDLSDPANPVFTPTAITSGVDQYSRIVAHGNFIQATGRNFLGTSILDIFDVSAPGAPVLVAEHGVDGFDSFSLSPEPGLAIGVGNQLSVFDLSDPTQMTRRSFIDIPPATRGVRVGSYFYSYGWGEGLDLWNIGNLDAPAAAGHLDIDALGGRTAVRMGSTLLLQTDTDLVHGIDVRSPAAPVRRTTGWLPGGVGARDVAVHAGRVLLLQPNSGFTLNTTDTLTPTARFEADLPQSLEGRSFEQVVVAGNTAYTASWGFGLINVDLSNPARPVELGRVEFPFAAVLDVNGDYAYVGKWTNGGLLAVADVSDPAAPSLVWQTELAAQPYRLKVNEQQLYVAEGQDTPGSGGLRVFDLSNPASPVPLGNLDDGCGTAFDVSIDSAVSLAYLACSDGLQVIDIADPAAPVVVGRYDAGSSSQFTKVAQRGDRAWFANTDGLHELDVSNPTAPVVRKITPLGHQGAERLAVLPDGSLYVLGGGTGVHIFRAPPQAAPKASSARVVPAKKTPAAKPATRAQR
jgi:hypothetical protein